MITGVITLYTIPRSIDRRLFDAWIETIRIKTNVNTDKATNRGSSTGSMVEDENMKGMTRTPTVIKVKKLRWLSLKRLLKSANFIGQSPGINFSNPYFYK